MLANGEWYSDWSPVDPSETDGSFVRQTSKFRNWVTPDGARPTGEGGFAAERGRYHLYVSLACPWACRTLIGRALRGLQECISVSIVEPTIGDRGWRFGDYPGADPTSLTGDTYLYEVYTRADRHVSGRATVPVLWDKQRETIVNNESADILRMLSTGFAEFGRPDIDLYPAPLRDEIDTFGLRIYESLNNGVYRAGLAQAQDAYAGAYRDVFATLDWLESRLLDGRAFFMGDMVTEADVRVFVTTVRFDMAYHGAFKLNERRLSDYRLLSAHLERMIALPGVRDTVSIDHIKRGYYSIKIVNPLGLVPLGPDLPWYVPSMPAS